MPAENQAEMPATLQANRPTTMSLPDPVPANPLTGKMITPDRRISRLRWGVSRWGVLLGAIALLPVGWVGTAAPAQAESTCRRINVSEADGANLRTMPEQNGALMGVVPNGREVTLNGPALGNWVSVTARTHTGDYVTGWIWAGLLGRCATAAVPQTTTQPTPAPQPTVPVATPTPSTSLCREVIYAQGLSIHREPSLSSERLGGVMVGDRLTLANTTPRSAGGAIWMQVAAPATGWVAVRSLQRAGQNLNVVYCTD